jgi:HAD superfamily hydrolase (TIGR01484 family)
MDIKRKTRLFFDLDGTLTPSRQSIKPAMADFLRKLDHTIIIVSGSTNEQIRRQVGPLSYFSLGQNGNQAIDTGGRSMWDNSLDEQEKLEVWAHIEAIRPYINHAVPDEQDLIEDRGSQISFSIYGHHAPPEAKKACDGDFKKRRALLTNHPFVSVRMEVQIGGSTCLDYFKKGSNKGSNVRRLIEMNGWKPEDCVYFGDALFPGGNDETVVGTIDAIPVRDEDDTLDKLLSAFSNP